MTTLATVLKYELLLLLLALIAIVGYRMMTRKINVTGLMMDKTSGRTFSPGRLQLLITTIGIAVYYIMMVIDTEDPTRLPNLPKEFILALGGSHGVYLAGKLYGRFATSLGLASPKAWERFTPKEPETNK